MECFEMLVHDLHAVLRLACGRPTKESSAVLPDSRTLCSTSESDSRAVWDGHNTPGGEAALGGRYTRADAGVAGYAHERQ